MQDIESLKVIIMQHSLTIKELIQRIHVYLGPIEYLHKLNHEGRRNISRQKYNIATLKRLIDEVPNPKERAVLLEDIKRIEDEYNATIYAFQRANVASLNTIDMANRRTLLGEDKENMMRHRKKTEKANLCTTSANFTDQLLGISRSLAESTERSAETLRSLVTSSATVSSTREELENTGNVIAQSGKLLSKYGRREKTDKVLIFFAFTFFLACVFYIIQKRLF